MELLEKIQHEEQYVIYGAQVVAYGAYIALLHLTGKSPKCFVVGYLEGNPMEIDHIPVRLLCDIPKNIFFVVGVTELVQKTVLPYLKEQGYHHIFALTQSKEHKLMAAYYSCIGKFPVVTEDNLFFTLDYKMFEVRNHRDYPLLYPPKLFPYEEPIQAGAALSEKRIAKLLDYTGENISVKNKQYCEMTAVYWIWKNTKYDWKGIEHYRRHLLVKPEMLQEEIDAILPLPYLCYPNTVSQFRRFVSEDVLQGLLKALKDLHPDQYKEYYEILYGKYQYTYNLVCAKEKVFHEYCQWFFEITEYMETMADEILELKNTRAFSYVAEVLTNIYFMSNQNKLNIRHVEKAIYI